MKKELSVGFMLFLSVVLGTVAATAIGGCQPAPVAESETLETAEGALPVTSVAAVAPETPEPAPAAAAEPETPASEPVAPSEPIASEAPEPAAPAPEAPAPGAESSDTATAEVSEPDDPQAVLEAGGDWPQWGGTRLRNNTPNVSGLPATWNVGEFDRRTGEWDSSSAENIKWVSDLGSQTYGNPVVADGRVFVGSNNGSGHLARYPNNVDLGVLLCFDEQTGEFLWQHSSEKLITGRVHDWPLQGICAAPMVEGERLWFVTSRGEVRCLDTAGFYDGEDDGPVQGELARVLDVEAAAPDYAEAVAQLAAGKLTEAVRKQLAERGVAIEGEPQVTAVTPDKKWQITATVDGAPRELTAVVAGPRLTFFKALAPQDKNEADVIWVLDMMTELGVSQHNMASCSVTSYGDLLFVNTSNGVGESHLNLPAPEAPSFICLDKNTGEVLWTDRAPGENILHGQWSSPAVGVLGGVPQVLFAGGDGWLYSYVANRGENGVPEMLWKFDCNPKESEWILGGAGTRNNLIATPVIYDGLVYIAVGQDPEHGEGEGHLWCIDPTKRGDVSSQLAVKISDGGRTPIAHKRIKAVDPEQGEAAIDNPNSAAVWHYSMFDQNGDGEIDFEEEMHRSCGTVAIKDDVLYIADFSGMLHCLNAKGGEDGKPEVHFTYDMLAQSWGSCLIADDKVYIGDEDGEVAVFEFGPENDEPTEEIYMGSSVYSTPIAANGVLFISTKDKLFAIAEGADAKDGN